VHVVQQTAISVCCVKSKKMSAVWCSPGFDQMRGTGMAER